MSDKPKMLAITDSWTLRVLEANQDQLDCPQLIEGKYVDAVEFADWKIALTQAGTEGVEE